MENKEQVERVNVVLLPNAAGALKNIQERTGLKKVDIVNRALLVHEFIESQLRMGNDIVIRDPEGHEQIVKFFL